MNQILLFAKMAHQTYNCQHQIQCCRILPQWNFQKLWYTNINEIDPIRTSHGWTMITLTTYIVCILHNSWGKIAKAIKKAKWWNCAYQYRLNYHLLVWYICAMHIICDIIALLPCSRSLIPIRALSSVSVFDSSAGGESITENRTEVVA